jgi:hypothetical protein
MTLSDYLSETFVRNALIAATLVAITAGLIGPVVIMRDLAFAVHGTAELAFTGAAAGLLVADDPLLGALLGSIVVATAVGFLGNRVRERNSAIGVILAFGLGVGVHLLSLYNPCTRPRAQGRHTRSKPCAQPRTAPTSRFSSARPPARPSTKPCTKAADVCAVRSRSDRRAHLFLMVMTGVGVPSRTPPADPVSAPAMRRAQALGRSAKSKTHPLSTSLADTEIVVAHRESMEPDIALLDDPDRR